MNDIGCMRTALFVPGNRPDRVDKAIGTNADIVIVDLEDAVPQADKISTRKIVRKKIAAHGNARIMVRINALDTDLAEGDLQEIVVPGLEAIMLPKVEKSEDVHQIHSMLLEAEKKNHIDPGSIVVVALIETAAGVNNVFQIAATVTDPNRLHCLAFGAADFTLDMGIQMTLTGEELFYPRSRLAIASRAAGINPPLDTPFMIGLKDRDAFQRDALRGKNLGFGGKLCIHPNQITLCNSLYSPGEKEIDHARKVIEAFEAAEAEGKAAIQVEGKFIDYPVVKQARRILDMAAKITRSIDS